MSMARLAASIVGLHAWTACVAFAAPAPPTAPDSIPLHQVRTIELRANGEWPSPFTDVVLDGMLTSPTGRHVVVPGFFDGADPRAPGSGVWKIRLAPDEVGSWTLSTRSNEPALDGVERTLNAVPSGVRGPVIRDPEHPHWFRYADGPPVHLHGSFLDRGVAPPLAFTHLLLSESLSESERRAMLDRALAIGANKIALYLANIGDYGGGFPVTPWLGTARACDRRRFDPARWAHFEREIARCVEQGLTPELWLLADDSGFGKLSDDELMLYLRYAMARLGAFPVLFTLALEWQEAFPPESGGVDRVRRLGRALDAANAWNRPISIHGTPGDFAFAGEPWVDFLATQQGFGTSFVSSFNFALRHWHAATPPKPHIAEEFAEVPSSGNAMARKRMWMSFVGGAAGTGTGSDIAAFDRFFRDVAPEFWMMEPCTDPIAIGGEVRALAAREREYVLYVPLGGEVRLSAEEFAAPYDFLWFDPREGTIRERGSIAPPETHVLHPPSPAHLDWVLVLRRR